ncbi:DoxX family membrane protein [Rhizobium sp. 2YAF20]|uniref:DoxX family protein n=1 Tax=Rhizobium sp. 2YAF20 TaxID=3233027 RepID=UPI003F9D11F7
MLNILVVFATRCMLVGLFLPFSALDKILNFESAVEQAKGAVRSGTVARLLIFAGLGVEILMSAAVLMGEWDRMAALILAVYCAITAIMWKQFWKTADFRLKGESRGREMFWDFLKNFALAGGFLTLAFGPNAAGVQQFLSHPLASSHPYTIGER